jgi:hypothetical protein
VKDVLLLSSTLSWLSVFVPVFCSSQNVILSVLMTEMEEIAFLASKAPVQKRKPTPVPPQRPPKKAKAVAKATPRASRKKSKAKPAKAAARGGNGHKHALDLEMEELRQKVRCQFFFSLSSLARSPSLSASLLFHRPNTTSPQTFAQVVGLSQQKKADMDEASALSSARPSRFC